MARFHPRRVVIVHDVAICAGGGVVGEVRGALCVTEGKDSKSGGHAHEQRCRDCQQLRARHCPSNTAIMRPWVRCGLSDFSRTAPADAFNSHWLRGPKGVVGELEYEVGAILRTPTRDRHRGLRVVDAVTVR